MAARGAAGAAGPDEERSAGLQRSVRLEAPTDGENLVGGGRGASGRERRARVVEAGGGDRRLDKWAAERERGPLTGGSHGSG
jgi:hypothetical protein